MEGEGEIEIEIEKLTMSFNGNDKVRFELTLPLAPELNSSLP